MVTRKKEMRPGQMRRINENVRGPLASVVDGIGTEKSSGFEEHDAQ
jgi:hypothetical protein